MSGVPAKRKPAGAPMWIVTFADLMSLLVCFFVLLISFSIQDTLKLQIVAGSMREAFGVQPEARKAGIIERDGNPMRSNHKFLQNLHIEVPEPVDQVGPATNNRQADSIITGEDMQFATTAATLRQALQTLPEITELSRHIVVEQTPDGLAIQLIDQDGRSMFAEGSSQPTERIRTILNAISPVLRDVQNRIRIAGHTAAGAGERTLAGGMWALSSERANAVRSILQDNGIPLDRFSSIQGFGDTDPMFPDNPFLAANRRVTVTLLYEAPPVPELGFK